MGKALNYFQQNGKIDDRKHCIACNFNCCTLDDDNYIYLFPWELDAAKKEGLSVEHLKVMKDNSQNAHCLKPCTDENDYKPVNCATYPLYPINENLDSWVRGAKSRCPITNERLAKQIQVVSTGLRKIEKEHAGSIKMLVDMIREYPGALEKL